MAKEKNQGGKFFPDEIEYDELDSSDNILLKEKAIPSPPGVGSDSHKTSGFGSRRPSEESEDSDLEVINKFLKEKNDLNAVVRWVGPPKTSGFSPRRPSEDSARLSSPVIQSNHGQFNQINQNVYYLNQFLSQLGSLQSERPDLRAFEGLTLNKPTYESLENETRSSVQTPISNEQNWDLPKIAASPTDLTKSGSESLYFVDGIRRIDMILAYTAFENDLDFVKEQKRKIFLRNLAEEYIEIEVDIQDPAERLTQELKTQFIKLHVPWRVLVKYAEMMNMKMPIKEVGSVLGPENHVWWKSWIKLSFFDYDHRRIPPEPSYYMASFNSRKEDVFLVKDGDSFFTPAHRHQILWKILTRIRSEDATNKNGGIRRLLNEEAFVAAYPLHEGPYDIETPGETPNERRLLYTEWAHVSNWYKRQPLNLVRRYFGDKIGLYFAWLGFYTAMLVPASVVGICCFLFGIATTGTDYNTPSREICNATIGGSIIMCPLCGTCSLWTLDDSCTFSKLTYFFDNPTTMFFAVFMAFWATSFMEFWKRKHAVIAWEWDLHSYELEEEPRPEFEAAVKTFQFNPTTQEMEPYLSVWSKAVRMLIVTSIVLLLLFMVAAVIIGIIIYRLVMTTVLYTTAEGSYEFLKDNAKIITSVSAAIMNLIVVVILQNKIYYPLATWLTHNENPRTQTEYEDSFTFKMFLFEFINCYSYVIYIAFFKGRFFRHPGDQSVNVLDKIRGDMCDPAGCFSELFIQLSIIMIGKQFFNNFMEIFLPKLSNWVRRRKLKNVILSEPNKPVFLSRWEQDFSLAEVDQLELFQEYLEMVIQYGFVTLFVAAFPLAPFFALLNNIVEIRLDAYKWTTQLRRPIAERVGDIGAWFGILQGLSYCSFCSSAFVIAYTSDIIPRLVYKYTSEDNSLQGYINSSLSVFPTTNYSEAQTSFYNVTNCRYRGYYNPPNHPNAMEPSDRYWLIMAARLAFVAVFEHLAFTLPGIMAYAIPDVPREVMALIQREKILATEALYKNDFVKAPKKEETQVKGEKKHVRQGLLRRARTANYF